jgi:hypothetical protein
MTASRFVGVVAVGLALGSLLHADIASAQVVARGYGFGGPGAVVFGGDAAGTVHAGGGAEAMIDDRLAVGGELGYLAPLLFPNAGLGVFSLNASYHFAAPRQAPKLRPFVTSGYSVFFRDGHENLWNVGGGVDYWVTRRTAFRAEFRDYLHPSSCNSCGALQFPGARFGVVFR